MSKLINKVILHCEYCKTKVERTRYYPFVSCALCKAKRNKARYEKTKHLRYL